MVATARLVRVDSNGTEWFDITAEIGVTPRGAIIDAEGLIIDESAGLYYKKLKNALGKAKKEN